MFLQYINPIKFNIDVQQTHEKRPAEVDRSSHCYSILHQQTWANFHSQASDPISRLFQHDDGHLFATILQRLSLQRFRLLRLWGTSKRDLSPDMGTIASKHWNIWRNRKKPIYWGFELWKSWASNILCISRASCVSHNVSHIYFFEVLFEVLALGWKLWAKSCVMFTGLYPSPLQSGTFCEMVPKRTHLSQNQRMFFCFCLFWGLLEAWEANFQILADYARSTKDLLWVTRVNVNMENVHNLLCPDLHGSPTFELTVISSFRLNTALPVAHQGVSAPRPRNQSVSSMPISTARLPIWKSSKSSANKEPFEVCVI